MCISIIFSRYDSLLGDNKYNTLYLLEGNSVDEATAC